VVARFSEPMVHFGDFRVEDPFTLDCAPAGQGHWIDSRNWVYDFATDLASGTRCTFSLRKDLKALTNKALGGTQQFSFDTGGPAVIDSLPGDGATGIDENQLFLLALDGRATPESISAGARCEIEGLGERIEVDVLVGDARQMALSSELREKYRYFFERFADDQLLAERSAVLKCRRSFPPDTEVRLVWGQGIASAGGLVTTQDQTLTFRSRAAFDARFECERVNPEAQCVPFLPMKLFFSAPIPADQAAAIRLFGRDGQTHSPDPIDPAKNPTVEYVTFKGPFPELAKFEIRLPTDLTDDAGRKLQNAARFPLAVATDEYPPLAKFSAEFGIIEAKEGGMLPVTLRNLEEQVPAERLGPAGPPANPGVPGQLQRFGQDDAEIIGWLKKVKTAAERRGEWIESPDEQSRWKELTGSTSVFEGSSQASAFSVPKPLGGKAFEVVGIPLTNPGFYVVELASPKLGAALLGEAKPRYVATSALVTNLAVHFKWGRESSLVWVTTLDKAEPVPRAQIRISNYCQGTLLWQGTTGPDGMAAIEGGRLPEPNDERACGAWNESTPPVFVSARTADDLSFTISGWNQGIQPANFGLATGSAFQARTARAVFDRTLLRAGETVSMKIFLRQRAMAGFTLPSGDRPDQLRVFHIGSGQQYSMPVTFDDQGIAETSWTIPREAKLGGYEVRLYRGDQWAYDAGNFQVQQFRVPTMRAVIQPAPERLVNATTANVDLFVSYLSGGGASGIPVKLRTQIQPRTLSYPDYADFSFGGKDLAEGIQDEAEEEGGEAPSETPKPARVLPVTLDRAGAARVTVPDLPKIQAAQDLVTELEYQDANGERLSVAQRIPLWSAKLNLGLRTEGWVASKDRLRFQVLVLDLAGKPVSGQAVRVDLLQKTTFSYRKRLVGGFYAYEDKAEIKRLDVFCEAKSDGAGLVACEVKPGISGNLILRATSKDDLGNIALATQNVWIEAGDDWWFAGGPSDRMDVLPEKRSYERGEKARFQVRSPFREATALVTVEREGVIDAFVTQLSGKAPVVEVPIKDHYAPNVYVSVLAVRGRPTEAFGWLKELGRKLNILPQDESVTALVDLNKPAYRLGVGRIDVGWAPYRLDVRVMPEKETYKVREPARVKLAVRRADGGPLPPAAEVAFAAVDEGLLELKPNTSWKLLEEMMGQRGIEVYTSTAQMQVVGKRHYGRKAIPHGGGGGRQAARELFDTLLLWRGRVPLDAQGEAEIDVPLNDSLTAFRLTAVANAGTGLFGTGDSTIRTTQDLMAHSGLPPLVREGDSFQAVFTLRNGSDRPLTIDAAARLTAQPETVVAPTVAPQAVTLKPGEAREIGWPIEVPGEAQQLTWELSAEEQGGGAAKDRLRVMQEVLPAVPIRVHQATLIRLDQPVRMAIETPREALPGRGDIRVALQAKLGDDASGVRDYMQSYPYSCLEQRVSRAVALRDRALWDEAMAQLPSYVDGDGLFKYFPADALRGSDVLTSYVMALAHEAGWPLPEGLQGRAVEGLKAFVEARVARNSPLRTADLVLRKLAAIEALSRYGAVKPEMLSSLIIEPNLWPTSALLDWLSILKRVDGVPQRAERLPEAQQILRSRLTFRGTTMGFSTEENDRLWWLMTTVDLNAVKALLLLADQDGWHEDLPRLMTGALGRQRRGHWDTTTANAWGVLALEKFGSAFQAAPVVGTTEGKLAEMRSEWTWVPAQSRGELDFHWPDRAAWLELEHRGTGVPWATIQSRAALPLKAADFSGYSIRRSVQPLEQKQSGVWSRGDVARVRLELEAQADMTWVVVDDPIPGGASILGTGLGRDSALLTAGERQEGWVWPIYEERRFDAFRAYYDYVPKGKWTVEYTLRLNNPGRFAQPPTRIEALYAPEVYGESPNPVVEIAADP